MTASQRLEELRRQGQRSAVALSSSGAGVITVNIDGRITFVNPVIESLTGWTARAAEGQPLEEILLALQDGGTFGLASHTLLVTDGECLGAELVFRNVTDRQQAEDARALLAGIIDSSEDAIISKSLDGIVTSWNAAAERMFGYTASEAIGRSITFLIPQARRNEEDMILNSLRQGRRIEHFETERLRKDGRLVAISLTVSPVRNRAGKIIGASKIARDISERLRAEAESARLVISERAARDQAESSSRAKDEFVATMSHEIRSPLSAILGWAQALRVGRQDASTTVRALESIERNARALAKLLDDLLDISGAITGKLRLSMRPVDLRRSLEAAIESIRPAAEGRSITLDTQVELNRSVVTGDADRLQQVFWNLLSNAVKFTPKHGRIAVRMRLLGSQLETTVSDSGMGISSDFLPFVFERFAQADTTITRRHGGLGLGLAVVRHLIELHGGTISAASAGPGQGATFTMMLPVRPTREDGPGLEPARSADEADVSLAGVRVMIVDDEPETRELLAQVLGTHGAEVTCCASAADALALIDEWKPAVLLSDIGMPDEDGYSLVRKVRRLSSPQRGVPAVALTAHARTEDRVRALAAGFQMHVPKPVEAAELVLAIARLAIV